MMVIKNENPTAFVRFIGLLLMVFGGFLIYTASEKLRTIMGTGILAVSLGVMIPAQVNTAFAIVIGALRSLGLVKRAPETDQRSGPADRRSNPKLGSTVSVPRDEIEKETEL